MAARRRRKILAISNTLFAFISCILHAQSTSKTAFSQEDLKVKSQNFPAYGRISPTKNSPLVTDFGQTRGEFLTGIALMSAKKAREKTCEKGVTKFYRYAGSGSFSEDIQTFQEAAVLDKFSVA